MTTFFIPRIPIQTDLFDIDEWDEGYQEDFDEWLTDWDGDALASAGFGTDEDYDFR